MAKTILHIDASARGAQSASRDLSAKIVAKLGGEVIRRDLSDGLPQLDEAWVNANWTPEAERSADQKAALALSDDLVAELQAANVLVIGVPIYNFGVPASLKAWVDLVARAGVTFNYTEAGPEGLLKGKRAILAVASGGTEVGSDMDFASGYMRQFLGFLGITDVEIVAADRLMLDGETSMNNALETIDALAA